jgi:uncharacterized membrane protein
LTIARLRGTSFRVFFGLLTLAPIAVMVAFLLFAPPDGIERTQLLQFIGRFHPLSVHLPIALLILVPLLELAGRSRHFPYLLPAADFVLGVATCGAVAAAILGWCLARSGGYSGPLMTQHMWGGISVAGAVWLCWILRAREGAVGLKCLYAVMLIGTVGLVSFTGYRGGQLSQGENHLTEFMPEPLSSLFGVGASVEPPINSPNGGAGTFYGARIQPVFAQHCVTCHGRSKHKANLRLDSYEGVMHGGKHGPVVKAGEANGSELFRRITLPPSDDNFMPPENKKPLSSSDAKLIEQWISAGASGTQANDTTKDVFPGISSQPAAEVTFEEIDTEAVGKQRASLAPVVAELQQRFPNILAYQSRSSADIVVSAAWMEAKFGDEGLAALAPLSGQIVVADFSSTSITDKSAVAIASMKHLRVLRLMHTRITDTTVRQLGSLDQLESLSLFDTPVTAAALPALARLPKLQHVYASQTKIPAEGVMPLEMRNKLVF